MTFSINYREWGWFLKIGSILGSFSKLQQILMTGGIGQMMTMNPWLFWMIWWLLANISIVMMGAGANVKPVTDVEWEEWQEYCKEQNAKRNSQS